MFHHMQKLYRKLKKNSQDELDYHIKLEES